MAEKTAIYARLSQPTPTRRRKRGPLKICPRGAWFLIRSGRNEQVPWICVELTTVKICTPRRVCAHFAQSDCALYTKCTFCAKIWHKFLHNYAPKTRHPTPKNGHFWGQKWTLLCPFLTKEVTKWLSSYAPNLKNPTPHPTLAPFWRR